MSPDFRRVLDGWAWDKGEAMYTSDEQFFDDERDVGAQQQADHEAQQQRLTDILRRMGEGRPVTRSDIIELAAGCGIDKRDVL